ncbi:CRISPR-associated protein Cas4 [Heliorestis acidaminivorans]|nr:CRISPR-associated protein Cas4 [Heliorestis acidaminivorans]
MFYLTPAEKHKLQSQLTLVRSEGVEEELRGWNYYKQPLHPFYEGLMLTMEDLIPGQISYEEVLYQQELCRKIRYLYREVRRSFYTLGVANYEILLEKMSTLQALNPHLLANSDRQTQLILQREIDSMKARLVDTILNEEAVSEDEVAATFLPLSVDMSVDGSVIGIEKGLTVDFLHIEPGESMPIVFFFQVPQAEHLRITTAYALAVEAKYKCPLDFGCITYLTLKEDKLIIERRIHNIDDSRRYDFIEHRDQVGSQ